MQTSAPVEKARARGEISRLALPLFAAEAAKFLAQIGVVAILGRMGRDAVYVRSLYQPIGYLLLALTLAFAVTNQVAAATSRGRGRPQDVLGHAVALARIWFLCGTVLCALLAVAAPWLAGVLSVGADAEGSFVTFLRWTCLAGLLGIAPELCASSLRGYRHVRQATVLTITTAALQVVIVAGLGLGAGIGVSAVPLAQAVSGLAGLGLGIAMLRRTELWRLRTAARARMRDALAGLRRIGGPVAASLLVIAGYNFALLGVLGRFGENAVAGFSVATTLQNFILLPGTVLGTATAIIINQQRGAGEGHRMRDTLRGGLDVTVVVYVPIAVVLWLLAHPIAVVLGGDPQVAAATGAYLSFVALTYAFQGPVLTALTAMEETGGGVLAIVLNVVYFGAIVVATALLGASLGGANGVFEVVACCNLMGVSVPFYALRYMRKRAAAAAV